MMMRMISVFTPLLFLCFLLPAAESDLAADRAALLLLRSVGGRTRWWNLSDQNPCSWKGVGCDNATGRVTKLRLPGAGLSGEIPLSSVGNLTQLRFLSLRRNSLSGEIPATLFALNNLVQLNLAGNGFSGLISPEFSNLTKLRTLYLENNSFTGSITQLNSLPKLRGFDVSFNQLSGSIPSNLNSFPSDSFLGNSLCGSPLPACPGDGKGSKKLSAGAIAGIAIGSAIGLILILVILFLLWRRRSTETANPRQVEAVPSPVKPPEYENPILARESRGLRNADAVVVNVVQRGGNHDGLVFFGGGSLGFGLEELLRASAEVLGKGAFGSTYKAYLEEEGGGRGGGGEMVVVVKRLRSLWVGEREFREKVERLGELVHENLVPLRGYYYGREERLLVFDCMPMGSLSALLHGNRGAADRAALTWEIRTKIAFGAAHGIEYLHSLNISHGNIKSSNILLTNFYTALVSEYGISQLLSNNTTILNHSNGYCAPEVTDTRRVSQKADVYSFGVVILELLTGKAVPNEEGIELTRWVGSLVGENRAIDAFDAELIRHHDPNREQQMVQLLHVGIQCTSQHPDKRPSMVEVTRQIRILVD